MYKGVRAPIFYGKITIISSSFCPLHTISTTSSILDSASGAFISLALMRTGAWPVASRTSGGVAGGQIGYRLQSKLVGVRI